MNIAWLTQDSLARRYALTIFVAVAVATSLSAVFFSAAGVWGRPSAQEAGLIDRADDIGRMISAAAPQQRPVIAAAASNPLFDVAWYRAGSADATALANADAGTWVEPDLDSHRGSHFIRIGYVDTTRNGEHLPRLSPQPGERTHALLLVLQLPDFSWVVFGIPSRFWGIGETRQTGIRVVLLLVSVIGVSCLATLRLSRPISRFTEGLRRFGTDPRATLMPETGPVELREAIRAFNGMQDQIQSFVDDRTAMLAAVSHDLRTPLTRIRLRGELVEDPQQRERLFRDIDEMTTMVDAALAFFRDDYQAEATTTFNVPELLRTVIDDYNDRGTAVLYDGPERLTFEGRPFALKRAFSNLVENAAKYAVEPTVELRPDVAGLLIFVRDRGPGIKADAMEKVFLPFVRLESSRNRDTGGVGLGLAAARTVVRAHGGEITLANRPGGGLEARVFIPARHLP